MSELPSLWKHQVDCIEKAKKLKGFALFFPPGTGKTRVILELLRHHYNAAKRVRRTLVVSPLIVTRNWEAEIEKYTKIPRTKYTRLEGAVASRAEQLLAMDGIVIVNYDSFVNPKFTEAVIKWAPEILVLDESHYAKTYNSKRTKAIHKVCEQMPKDGYRYIMTGTPIANSQMDIWSQFYCMDLGETFGKSFFGFRGNFFRNLNSGRHHITFPMWVPKPGASEVISKLIQPKSMVVKKEECLDLPPLIEKTIEVELTREQERAYDQMKNDLITFIDSSACVASIALVKALRLQQIVSGYLPLEDGTVKQLDSNRPKALRELLELIPTDAKVIIWAVFHNDYQTIAEVCKGSKIEYTEAHGLVPEKKKYENIEAFKTDPKVRVLIGSPAAIGIGINIVEAQYSIWFSRNFSMVQDDQARARNYRGGSNVHTHITRYDLVAADTIDKTVLDSVRNKYNIAEKVLKSAKSIL